MTRCKPGDLAFVINEDPPCGQNIGKIVRVLGPASKPEYGEWEIEPTSPDFLIYSPVSKKVLRYADTKWAWIVLPDKDLRPIRDPGADAKDETLSWLPAPTTSEGREMA